MPEPEQGAIVVVEDDDSMRSAAQRVLDAGGFRARAFASAESLLESGAARDAACMVLDIHLPGLSGFELCHELARVGLAYPPLIFITAHDDAVARARAEALGACAFLPKPFAGRTLLEAVARAVGKA